jgi:hypothetical protein
MFYQTEPNSVGYKASSTHGHSVSSLQQLVDTGRSDMTASQNSANAEAQHKDKHKHSKHQPNAFLRTHDITNLFPYNLFYEVPVNQSIGI